MVLIPKMTQVPFCNGKPTKLFVPCSFWIGFVYTLRQGMAALVKTKMKTCDLQMLTKNGSEKWREMSSKTLKHLSMIFALPRKVGPNNKIEHTCEAMKSWTLRSALLTLRRAEVPQVTWIYIVSLHDCMLNAELLALGACFLYIFNFWESIKNIWFWGPGHCSHFPAVFRQCGHHLGCLDDMQLQSINSHAFLQKTQFLEDGFANDLCSCRCLLHTRKCTNRPTDSLSSLAEKQMLPGAWNTGVCRAFALTTPTEGTGIISSNPVGSRVLLAVFVGLCTFFLLTCWWFTSWVMYIGHWLKEILIQPNGQWWPGAQLLLSYSSIPKAWCYSHQYARVSASWFHPRQCGSSIRHWEMRTFHG